MPDPIVIPVKLVSDNGNDQVLNQLNNEVAAVTQAANSIPVRSGAGGTAGGASSSAAGAAARTAGSAASTRPSSNPGPPPGRVPTHQASGTVGATVQASQPRTANSMARTINVPDLGSIHIPTQSGLRFADAFTSQTAFADPQEYAPHYAMGQFEAARRRSSARTDRRWRVLSAEGYPVSAASTVDELDEIDTQRAVERVQARQWTHRDTTYRREQAENRRQAREIDRQVRDEFDGIDALYTRRSISDSAIRSFVNSAPDPRSTWGARYASLGGAGSAGGAGGGGNPPTLSGDFANPWNYNLGSGGQLMALRQQLLDALPGYGTRFAKGGLIAAGQFVQAYAQNEATYAQTGRRDIAGEAGAAYGLLGGVAGAAVGSLFPGFGTVIGAGLGSSVGNQVGQYVMASTIGEITRQQAVQPAAALSASYAGDYGGWHDVTRDVMRSTGRGYGPVSQTSREWQNPALPAMGRMAVRAQREAEAIGRLFWKPTPEMVRNGMGGDYTQYYMSGEQLAHTYSSAYGALIEAGIDPEQKVQYSGPDVVHGRGNQEVINQGIAAFNRDIGKHANINQHVGLAITAIGATLPNSSLQEGGQTSLYRMLSENAAKRWGKAGEEIFQKATVPIISTIQQTGGNVADILTRYGVGNTDYYLNNITDLGQKPVATLQELMKVHSFQEQSQRALRFSAMTPRGQGERAYNTLGAMQDSIGSLADGKDSLVYAELGEQRRQAMMRRNREQDIMGYDLPMAALEGQETRRQYLPNMPGYGLKLSLERMSLRTPYLRQRQSRYAAQVAAGQLSEEEQLQQFHEIQGLQNAQARDLGMMAEGGQDRMLAFSAGRPSFFSRMDSMSLARLSLWNSGSPQVGMGSVHGRHLQYQNNFFRQFDAPGFDALSAMAPHSRTGPMNGPNAATGQQTATLRSILDVLNKILANTQTGGMFGPKGSPASPTRPGESFGNLGANISASRLDPRAGYGRGQ